MRAFAIRVSRWAIDPARGLGPLWFVCVLGLLVAHQILAVLILVTATFIVLWAAMLAVSAVIPRPPRLQDQSALFARALWVVRMTWAAVLFGLSAFYGALAGVQVDALVSTGATMEISNAFWSMVSPIVSAVITFAGWYAIAGCAWDLWRIGPDARRNATVKLLRPLRDWSGAPWIQALILVSVRGWLPWFLAYVAPVMLLTIGASVRELTQLAPFRLA